MDPAVFATGVLNALAAAGACGHALFLARRLDRTPLEARFMAVSGGLGLLAGIRALDGLTGLPLQRLEDVLSALAPLGVLVLAEGALRRHAPRMVKLATLAGAGLFATLALIRPEGAAVWLAVAFAGYLLAVIAAVGVLLAGRERDALSAAENRLIGGLGLVLILAAPLALTDFEAIAATPPIRLGALAILLVVYAAIRLSEPEADAGGLARDGALVVGLGGLGGILAGGLFPGAAADDMIRVGCLLSAGAIALLCLWRLRAERLSAQEPLHTLSGAALGRKREAYLAEVLATSAFGDLRLFGADALADSEPERIAGLFCDRLVATSADLAHAAAGSDEDALRALMDTAGVTHAAAVSLSPLTLAAVNAGGLADRKAWTARLAVLARIARALPSEAGHAAD